MDRISERYLIFIIFLVQYITIYEFVIINPLAPDYILELGILSSDVGLVAGSYSLSAAISGIIAVTFIDNYDRKKVLLYSLVGLLLGTIICLASFNFTTFILATILKGMFTGPATTIALAILTDAITPAKRGKALSKVMTAFPLVAAVGVPISLEISNVFDNWRLALAINIAVIIGTIYMVFKKMPEFKSHLVDIKPIKLIQRYQNIFNKWHYVMALFLSFVSYFAGFLLIPNLPNYFIFNLDYPRENLGLLYMIGGLISFFSLRIVGTLIDKNNSKWIIISLISVMLANLYFQFFSQFINLPIIVFFVIFMLCMSSRNIVISTLATKIPSNYDRASFFSIFNVCVNTGAGLGGFVSSLLLTEGANLELIHIERVALLSMAATILIPFIIFSIEKMIKKWQEVEPEVPTL